MATRVDRNRSKAKSRLSPIFRILKLLAFRPRMFRRGRSDETILPRTKPFFPFGADIPKRWLINNPPNETPSRGELGACHAERHRHQRRSPQVDRRCPRDIG
jgi:hypothetical protein